MLRRLRIKFVCINMAIVTVMLCIMFGTVMYVTHERMVEESLRMMHGISLDSMRPGRPDNPAGHVQLPYFAVQLGAQGEVLATRGGYYDLSDRQMLEEIVSAARRSGEESGLLDNYDLRYLVSRTPGGEVMVFADISNEAAIMNGLVRTCMGIGTAGFFAFLAISLLLARWAVRPVEEAWERQRQFVGDASHELKTPLTVIMTNAELLSADPESPERRRQLTQNILTMSRQMRGLVEGLLELARLDNGGQLQGTQVLDLGALAAGAALPFEAVFFERALTLDTELAAGVLTKGDPAQLRQVTDILLDNAQKYAAPGTRVVLGVKRVSRGGQLWVENQGETIPPEELEHLFERFYRGDKARSMNRSYGLGLPIARGIVERHRGRIWAESREGRTVFYVQLPGA